MITSTTVYLSKQNARRVFEIAAEDRNFRLCDRWEAAMAASVLAALLSARDVWASLLFIRNKWNSAGRGVLTETELTIERFVDTAGILIGLVAELEDLTDAPAVRCLRNVPGTRALPEDLAAVQKTVRDDLLKTILRFLAQVGDGQATTKELEDLRAELLTRSAVVFDEGGKVATTMDDLKGAMAGLKDDWRRHRAAIRNRDCEE